MAGNQLQHHLLQIQAMILRKTVGNADRLPLRFFGIIGPMQVKAAAVQMHKLRAQSIHPQGMRCYFLKYFSHSCLVQIIQATIQGIIVKIFPDQVWIDQQVDRFVVHVVWHQI